MGGWWGTFSIMTSFSGINEVAQQLYIKPLILFSQLAFFLAEMQGF